MSFTRPTGPAVPSRVSFTCDDFHQVLAEILMRMTGEHWEALEYVERYGLVPACEAVGDLEEWNLVVRQDTGEMFTSGLGDAVLEERDEAA